MFLTTFAALALSSTGAPGSGLAPALPQASSQAFAVRADVLVLGDGTRVDDGVLVVRDGKIAAAGTVEVPEGMHVHTHAGYLSPGLVAASARLLPSDEAIDTTRPFLAEARLIDGFDQHSVDVRAALEAGITTAVLSPTPNTVVGGRTGVVKTNGVVLQEDAHLAISMQASAIRGRSAPTGYSGLVAGLRSRLEAGEGVYGELTSSKRLAFIRVDDRHEITRALDLAGQHSLRGMLVGPSLAGEVIDLFEGSGMALVLPSYGAAEATGRTLESTAVVTQSAIPFGFSLSDPLEFRFPAAAALRAGAEAPAIERGFFANGAALSFAADRVGRLAPGLDADFVLWSGDPLSLTSRVESVFIDGAEEYRRATDTSESGR